MSGDYYWGLPFGSELGLAVGDICGKGISAALLMTNLQATLRSNVINLRRQEPGDGQIPASVLVESLNSQICGYTADNRFASFFYAIYDDVAQSLTYCNAGHNPPLFFSGRDVRKLMVGGPILGVFDDATLTENAQDAARRSPGGVYGQDCRMQGIGIRQTAGSLVLDNRDLPADRIKDAIVRQVLSWAYAEERDDDMTLVIARIAE